MAVPLDFIWMWVEICDLQLTTNATMRLIGKTIGSLLQVDHMSPRNGVARVRMTLPLNDLVRLDRMLRVLSEDVIHIQYRYERLVDRCRDCMVLNHDGLACPRSLETSADQGMQSETAVVTVAPPIVFRASVQHTLVVLPLPSMFHNEK
ncbi:hypothetical protein ACLB2K_073229 [Fragaria x ananassa]